MRSLVGSDQNTGTLICYRTSHKEWKRIRWSIQHLKHKKCRVGVRCKQYTGVRGGIVM